MSADNLAWAEAYARAGMAVLPVWYEAEIGGQCACDKGEACDRPAKHPIPRQGIKQATTDLTRIRAWWQEHPRANVALATGEVSGTIVIDVDTGDGKEGDVSITTACADKGGVPRTLTARSGSGGAHYFYRFRRNQFTRKIGFLKHVDYLSDGGYVIVAPSRNLKGAYAWAEESGLDSPDAIEGMRTQLAELPEWFDGLEGRGRSGRKPDPASRQAATRRARMVNGAAIEFNARDPKWLQVVRDALAHIDPDARDLWVKFGIVLGRAFERSDDGWAVYEEWASRSSKFSDKGTTEFMRNYYYVESLNMPQGGEPATIASIFGTAQEGGWTYSFRDGLDSRPIVSYRAGRAKEAADLVLRHLSGERESDNDGEGRVYAFGSGLGQVIQTHDFGAMYSKDGLPPNGWPMKVVSYTPMALGTRITHSCTIMRFSPTGSTQQVECPPEVSQLMLSQYSRSFPRLNGVVQWPIVVDARLAGFDAPYDARAGLVFSLPESLDLSKLRGTRKEAERAYKWLLEVGLEGFPLEDREKSTALALLLTFMQRRAMRTAPAFLITAPVQGTGKTALARFASRVVHGRSLAAASLSGVAEEQRKSITATLIDNAPAHLFDNLKEGTAFNSEDLAVSLTADEWTDRRLGVSEKVTLPNRTVWVFTGNNVTLKGDLRRRFVTVRLVSKLKKHYTQKFTRVLDEWAVEHRDEVLHALSAIGLWGAQLDPSLLKSESGFSDWDRQVRLPVMELTGIDPFLSSAEQNHEEEEDEEAESIASIVVAWAMTVGGGTSTVREFVLKVEDAGKGGDSERRLAAAAFRSGVALLRGIREDKLTPEDYGYAIKVLQDRLIEMSGTDVSFVRTGLKNKVAVWQLKNGKGLWERVSSGF